MPMCHLPDRPPTPSQPREACPTHAMPPARWVRLVLWALLMALGVGLHAGVTGPALGMQGGFAQVDVPSPPPLPRASALERWTLEEPLLLMAVCVALGVAAYVVLNGRGNFRAGISAAGVCVVLAAGVFGLSRMVETPRERMKLESKELVRAVAEADMATLDRVLTDDAELIFFLAPQGWGKERIKEGVQGYFGESGSYAVAEWTILEIESTVDGPDVGRVQLKARVYGRSFNFPSFSWWRLDFRREPDGRWRVRGIQPISIAGVNNAGG